MGSDNNDNNDHDDNDDNDKWVVILIVIMMIMMIMMMMMIMGSALMGSLASVVFFERGTFGWLRLADGIAHCDPTVRHE